LIFEIKPKILKKVRISQISSGFFGLWKKAKHVEKSHIFTTWLHKSQIGNPGSERPDFC